jgi:DNA-binding CsgD family transcriptional regulator
MSPLAAREAQILALARLGLSTKQIATHLGISPKTVAWHLRLRSARQTGAFSADRPPGPQSP